MKVHQTSIILLLDTSSTPIIHFPHVQGIQIEESLQTGQKNLPLTNLQQKSQKQSWNQGALCSLLMNKRTVFAIGHHRCSVYSNPLDRHLTKHHLTE